MKTIKIPIWQVLLIIIEINGESIGDITVESVYRKVTELEVEMNTLKVKTSKDFSAKV